MAAFIWITVGMVIVASVARGMIGPTGKTIICPNPNCGYRGPSEKKARGSTLLLIVLLCFFIIPGLLYLLLRSGYRYSCPRCRMQVGSDN